MNDTTTQPSAVAEGFAIPQVSFSSAPALEVRELNGGKPAYPSEHDAELATFGAGWRYETANEFRALYDATRKNQHGAYSVDDSLHPDWYLSSDTVPGDPSARVVVGFRYGLVYYYFDYVLARARAVRVAGQSSAL